MYFLLKIVLSAILAQFVFSDASPLKPKSQSLSNQQKFASARIDSTHTDEIGLQQPVQQFSEHEFSNKQQEIEESAVYDPISAPSYHVYAAQDPIKPYVNSYLDPNAMLNKATLGIRNGATFGTGLEPSAFAVQTGYEGYLVPGPGPMIQPSQETILIDSVPSPLSAITSLLPSSRTAISAFGRSFSLLLRILGVAIFSGGITSAICTLTPLCTISFALPFIGLRATAKKIVETIDVDKETSDRVARAADFVQTAIEKFQKLQQTLAKTEVKIEKEVEKETESKTEEKFQNSK